MLGARRRRPGLGARRRAGARHRRRQRRLGRGAGRGRAAIRCSAPTSCPRPARRRCATAPALYDQYLTLDLLALTDDERAAVTALHANALSCVAPVGVHGSELPPEALVAAAGLLAPDALVVYMHDPNRGVPDADHGGGVGGGWAAGTEAQELERRRYVHRHTVNGAPFEMDGVVLAAAARRLSGAGLRPSSCATASCVPALEAARSRARGACTSRGRAGPSAPGGLRRAPSRPPSAPSR